ncbi:TRAP transporter large permease [Pikeienuella piscinae]|uniref:TRAP transporter large permease protein n=1 Tax=Pikeienuella piscinae TaxID=2748098 RepID=A0A7L5BSW8_9RHOB|nr:TRAP transporter large permease [Pikeienuella piscinae]QIE54162.1 TRAP transporter large permease [Pikeienuella piscinae]
MDPVQVSLILFGVFTLLIPLGVPIAHALGAAALCLILAAGIPGVFLPQTIYHATDQFPLIAVPFFVLVGYLMEYGGVSCKLTDMASALVGHVTGGFAAVTIVSCMFFAAMSGAGPATVAAIGTIMIPAMIRSGYPAPFAGAVASTGGTLGIMIPPSTPMIIYAVVGNVSVTQMFIAGVAPGLLTRLVLIVASWWICRRYGYTARTERASSREIARAFWNGCWALMAPVIVLGGIYGGVFTPTEASIIAVNYALVVGFFMYRELNFRKFVDAFVKSVMVGGTVTIIVGVAGAFGRLLTQYQIPQMLSEAVLSHTDNVYVVMIIIAVGLIIIGTFMETLATIVLLTPILLPVCVSVGIDPILFGILLVITSEIGFLTPPLGANLFVAAPIAKVSLEAISLAVLPFIALLCAVVLILILFPILSVGLPELLSR